MGVLFPGFYFWSVFLEIVKTCDLPVFLGFSAGVFTVNYCCFFGMGNLDELGEGRLEEYFDSLRMESEKKGGHSMFPSTEMAMRFGVNGFQE